MPNILTTIETDLAEAGSWLESEAESVAGQVWNTLKVIWTTLEPTLWADLLALVETTLGKVQSNDLGDLVQALLMEAETQGKDFVSKLEEAFLTAVISAVKLKIA